MDESDIDMPGERHRGMTLRTWDPERRCWSIQSFDSRRPGPLFPAAKGGFARGLGIFYGDETFAGRPIRVRFVWSYKADRSARWEQAFSLDEGNSWETNWTMDFTRM